MPPVRTSHKNTDTFPFIESVTTQNGLGMPAAEQPLPPAVVSLLDSYTPVKVSPETWAQMHAAVVGVVTELAPPSVHAARRNLSMVVPYVQWVFETFGDDSNALFTPRRVAQFCALAGNDRLPERTFTSATVNEFASQLTTIGRRVNPGAPWPHSTVGTTHRSLKSPYSDSEMRYLRDALTTPGTHQRPGVQRAFHVFAGAGLTPAEFRAARTCDITIDNTVVSITVGAQHRRTVPLVQPHAAALADCLPEDRQGFLLARRDTNALAVLFRTFPIGADAVVLSAGRLRTTWIVHRLRAGMSPVSVARFAGLTSYTFMTELAEFVPEQDAAGIQAALISDVLQ